MVSAAQAGTLRTIQTGLTGLMSRDLAEFFGSLDLTKPELARDALLEFLPALIAQYGLAGAAAAADWYDEIRSTGQVAGRFRARPAEMPAETSDKAQSTVRRTAGYLFVEGQAQKMLPAMTDPATKHTLAPVRATIVESTESDPAAAGWQRIARLGACDFCLKLTHRGAVFKSSDVADFEAHGHCHCVAAPAWW